MFSWIKTRRDGKNGDNPARRAFRPEADRLESREVLSTLSLPGASRTVAIPGVTGHALANFATSPGGFLSNLNNGRFSNFSVTAPTNPIPSGNTGAIGTIAIPSFTRVSSGQSNPLKEAGQPTSLPREPGTPGNIVNNGGLLSTGLNLANGFAALNNPANGFTALNSPALANSTSVVNGLAFDGGLGLTTPFNRFANLANTSANNGLLFTGGLGTTNGSVFNSPTNNGLRFTNNLGGTNPAGGINNATNGLAFSGNTGLTVPAALTNSLSNAASNTLAFSNGLGTTLPSFNNPFVSSASNGLVFNGGTGFINQNRNPFLGFAANSIGTAVPTIPVTGTTLIPNANTGTFSSLLINSGNAGMFNGGMFI